MISQSSTPAAGSSRFTPRAVLGAGLFFSVIAVLMTWPLIRDLPHTLSDPGDPFFCTWVIHWDWHQIFRDPLNLFQANIFHPAKYTLAFSENLLGAAIFGFPLFFAGFSPVTVYNVLFLLGMVLSAWGAWALATELTGDPLASLIAGIFYAFVPFRFDHFAHIQFQWGGFIPLALLFLIRYFKTYSIRDLGLFGLFFVWNIYSCIYYGIYGTLVVLLVLLVEAVRIRLWQNRRATIHICLALLICGGAVVPILHPYSAAARLYDFHRSMDEILGGGATLPSYLSAGFRNRTYGRLTARFALPERQLFYGVTVPILAAVGLFFLGRRVRTLAPDEKPSDRTAPWLRAVDVFVLIIAGLRLNYAFTGGFHFGRVISVHDPFWLSLLLALFATLRLCIQFPRFSRYQNMADFLRRSPWSGPAVIAIAVTLLGWMLSAGPEFFLYKAFYRVAPFVMAGLRVPARAVTLTHIGLGILAAFGLSFWRRRFRGRLRTALPLLMLGATLFEFRAAPIDYYHADTRPLETSAWLASHSFQGGVLELPWGPAENIEDVYHSTEHNRPILNWYSGFGPRAAQILESRLGNFPIPFTTFHLLENLDCRLIVFHPNRSAIAEARVIGEFLAEGIREKLLIPFSTIHGPRGDSFIFETAWRKDSISPAPSSASLDAARKEVLTYFRTFEHPIS